MMYQVMIMMGQEVQEDANDNSDDDGSELLVKKPHNLF